MRLQKDIPAPTWVGEEVEARELAHKVERALQSGVRVGLDTETTGLVNFKDSVVFWSICFEENSRYCLPRDMLFEFAPVFENKDYSWLLTNAKFDKHMLANTGLQLNGKLYDTLNMDTLLDQSKEHGLKPTALRHLGLQMRSYRDVFGSKPRGDNRSEGERLIDFVADPATREEAVDYASLDAWATFKLGNYLEQELRSEDLWSFMPGIYVPLTNILWDMEREGITVNPAGLNDLRVPMEEENLNIEKRFAREAGKLVNLRSTPDMRWLFFDKLKKKPIFWTSGGSSGDKKPSLNEKCLEAWANRGDKLAKLLLTYRRNTKLLGTYIGSAGLSGKEAKGLLQWMDNNFRVHTTFNSHIAATGRLSSRDPNLQNIPVRSAIGKQIRDCFISSPGKVLICADYSQLEMTILAHMSDDENMIGLINEGKDIHSGTASLVFGIEYEDIMKAVIAKDDGSLLTDRQKELIEFRTASKTIGFGLLYEMGVNSLAAQLKCPKWRAEQYMSAFFRPFPGIPKYIDRQHKFVARHNKVFTLLGRPRKLYGSVSGGATEAASFRQATNTPIQGTAADIVMLAMMKCADNKELKNLGVKMLLQIHDELIFEAPIETAQEAVPVIKECMEYPGVSLKVPLRADPGVGMTWADAKK
jgi:DNA polymerase-1